MEVRVSGRKGAAKRTQSSPAKVAKSADAPAKRGKRAGQQARSGKAVAPRAATSGRFTGRDPATLPVTISISPLAEAGYSADGPVARIVDALGNNVAADILGVSRSQPSRWRSGKERLSPENRKRVSDLDHVLDRLLLELYPDQAGIWLTGPNPHLGGARPVDVLELRGAAAVLPAIDALAAGAFA